MRQLAPGQIGILAPEPTSTGRLCTGQVGYLITGMKTTCAARIGDTLHLAKLPVPSLPGFQPIKAMVFAGGISVGWIWFGVLGAL